MFPRSVNLPISGPLLLLGAFTGRTPDPSVLLVPAEVGSHARSEVLPGALSTHAVRVGFQSPQADHPRRAAPGDAVRVMMGPIMHFAIPEGPRDSSALGDAVASHLRSEPGVEVVEPDEDATHMVAATVNEAPDGRALIQVRLIRYADRTVIGQRGADGTLGPGETPLARRIADEVLRLIEEAGLR